jgi:ABC-type antimicrobial peptide transport system permease subunit
LMATLSGLFGFLAALLAATGLYGVISYMVVQRTKEIGIRMAIGAERVDVAGMILREAGILTVAGLVIGTALALASASSEVTALRIEAA